jgi:hypothetical protein
MIEPLYSLDVAVELIPVSSREALNHIISRRAAELGPAIYHHGSEPRYRNGRLVDYAGGPPRRMLTESDCLKIREMVTSVGLKNISPRRSYGNNGRPPKVYQKHTTVGSPGVWNILVADEVENAG